MRPTNMEYKFLLVGQCHYCKTVFWQKSNQWGVDSFVCCISDEEVLFGDGISIRLYPACPLIEAKYIHQDCSNYSC